MRDLASDEGLSAELLTWAQGRASAIVDSLGGDVDDALAEILSGALAEWTSEPAADLGDIAAAVDPLDDDDRDEQAEGAEQSRAEEQAGGAYDDEDDLLEVVLSDEETLQRPEADGLGGLGRLVDAESSGMLAVDDGDRDDDDEVGVSALDDDDAEEPVGILDELDDEGVLLGDDDVQQVREAEPMELGLLARFAGVEAEAVREAARAAEAARVAEAASAGDADEFRADEEGANDEGAAVDTELTSGPGSDSEDEEHVEAIGEVGEDDRVDSAGDEPEETEDYEALTVSDDDDDDATIAAEQAAADPGDEVEAQGDDPEEADGEYVDALSGLADDDAEPAPEEPQADGLDALADGAEPEEQYVDGLAGLDDDDEAMAGDEHVAQALVEDRVESLDLAGDDDYEDALAGLVDEDDDDGDFNLGGGSSDVESLARGAMEAGASAEADEPTVEYDASDVQQSVEAAVGELPPLLPGLGEMEDDELPPPPPNEGEDASAAEGSYTDSEGYDLGLPAPLPDDRWNDQPEWSDRSFLLGIPDDETIAKAAAEIEEERAQRDSDVPVLRRREGSSRSLAAAAQTAPERQAKPELERVEPALSKKEKRRRRKERRRRKKEKKEQAVVVLAKPRKRGSEIEEIKDFDEIAESTSSGVYEELDADDFEEIEESDEFEEVEELDDDEVEELDDFEELEDDEDDED